MLLGSAATLAELQQAFPVTTVCHQLPSPALQHPELLQPLPEELAAHELDCADLTRANTQALMINQRVAAEAADFLVRLTTGGLTRFATYFDLDSGSARSKYITPEAIANVVSKTPQEVFITQ